MADFPKIPAGRYVGKIARCDTKAISKAGNNICKLSIVITHQGETYWVNDYPGYGKPKLAILCDITGCRNKYESDTLTYDDLIGKLVEMDIVENGEWRNVKKYYKATDKQHQPLNDVEQPKQKTITEEFDDMPF